MIKFCIALAYLHWALKRQAENRHHLLSQGMAFLLEYHDDRRKTDDISFLQEAEFNVGRAYQMLGVMDLAIPRYLRCLQLGQVIRSQPDLEAAENFAHEASIALQTHYAANGECQTARDITMAWLIL